MSPFAIQKQIFENIGTKVETKRMGAGILSVRIETKEQLEKLKALGTIQGKKAEVTPNDRLNKSVGVITCVDLLPCTMEEIVQELKGQGVIEAYRITRKVEGQILNTPTIKLIFNKNKLPNDIKAAYINVKVRPYIPLPTKCFNCQQFGHPAKFCKSKQMCECGKTPHAEEEPCLDPPKCINCEGMHTSRSPNCPIYIKEKVVMEVKAKHNLTYREAKSIVYGKSFVTKDESFAQRAAKSNNNKAPNTTEAATKDDEIPRKTDTTQAPTSRPDLEMPPPSNTIRKPQFTRALSNWTMESSPSEMSESSIKEMDESDQELSNQSAKRKKGCPLGVPRPNLRKNPSVTTYKPKKQKL
ncbi:hypothetical protein RN001_009589 [Aquatica leii]|uniref:Gag-like protein n=1 Tax=Aquatica leii TaxID=1421715 RepID=A0AAN7QGJ6_9COLE|nr:hypothetical protein RN001_009589 [Aquatica leii]